MLSDQFHTPPLSSSSPSIMTGMSLVHSHQQAHLSQRIHHSNHTHPHHHTQHNQLHHHHQHVDLQQQSYGHHFNTINLQPQQHQHNQQQSNCSLDLRLRNSNDLIVCGQSPALSMAPMHSSSYNNPFFIHDSTGLLDNNLNNDNRGFNSESDQQHQRAIRSYYQPQFSSLMETYHQSLINMTPPPPPTAAPIKAKISSLSSSPISTPSPLNSYTLLNQKRESVITFSHTNTNQNDQSQQRLTSISKLYPNKIDCDDKHHEDVRVERKIIDESKFNGLLLSKLANIGRCLSNNNNNNDNENEDGNDQRKQIVIVNNISLTIDQIICICQVLQKSDLEKLEKFIYDLPNDTNCNKNELIIRARAIAAYHSGNFRQVYELLETNTFSVKYHQELQSLWNNAHYKEHEMKRGHPPGAVEKYRIRKKYQFPRTIWDGEEYVYCFKEKNRRILKEFYQKCNLPTQEDKLKLSNETQLTVVQISNWFKNRRQRDRQPHNHHHHHHHHTLHNHNQHVNHGIHEDQELSSQQPQHHHQHHHTLNDVIEEDDDDDDDHDHEHDIGNNHRHHHHHHSNHRNIKNGHNHHPYPMIKAI